jgi:hypothetical protein
LCLIVLVIDIRLAFRMHLHTVIDSDCIGENVLVRIVRIIARPLFRDIVFQSMSKRAREEVVFPRNYV